MKSLATRSRRAFSLIEVMIAILILALGLLGLGAVIPVVVKQQRSSSDTTLSIGAARAIETYLLSRPEFDPNSTGVQNAWAGWLSFNTSNPQVYDWKPGSTTGANPEIDLNTGEVRFFDAAVGTNSTVVLTQADRLWPTPSSQPVQTVGAGLDPYRPQFVWDMVCRRVKVDSTINPPTISSPDQIQVAIFVRRIDANIPLPRTGGTNVSVTKLVDLLSARNGNPPQYVPVAVESKARPIPTNKGDNGPGVRVYGMAQTIDNATFRPSSRDLILIPKSNRQEMKDLAARPDQKLVDNLGNVYTVREVVEDANDPNDSDSIIVRVTPPVPNSVGDPNGPGVDPETRFHQLMFMPQIPGTVRIFSIIRPK